jgi:hypothetical protein
MSCNEIQNSLALYCDDGLTIEERGVCYSHLEVCPVCRARLSELRAIRRSLAVLAKPAAPPELVPAINRAVAVADAKRARRAKSFGDLIAQWLQVWVMRYAFSSLASLLLFASVFVALRPHMIALHEAALVLDRALTEDDYIDPLVATYDIHKPISPESYAALRMPYNAESPSLNPAGALATFTSTTGQMRMTGRQDADDMTVVADVFTNGTASLADVMRAPKDRRLLEDFQKALRENAFVPASMDRRRETMRVVFSVQRVEVRERGY